LESGIQAREAYAAQLNQVRALETEIANLKAESMGRREGKLRA
jgi:hypothetical protein